jgi:pimeloyl-ACP methyl ester carboxylesterase
MNPPDGRSAVVPSRVSALVAMPGAGSDGDYADRALRPLAVALGVPLIAVDPGPDGIVATYLAALDDAAARGPVVAAGISIGACVAVHWAATRPASCAGVVAASPPWPPGGAVHSPAAAAARATVAEMEVGGLDGALARMRASSPAWLADELGRSWTAIGDRLADQLREAASTSLPRPDDLVGVTVPAAVVAVCDDPVHPSDVAVAWAAALGVVGIDITFDDWAADPGTIGRAAARALVPSRGTVW